MTASEPNRANSSGKKVRASAFGALADRLVLASALAVGNVATGWWVQPVVATACAKVSAGVW